MKQALILILTLLAIASLGWGVVAAVRGQDGRATALGVLALACFAVAQLLLISIL